MSHSQERMRWLRDHPQRMIAGRPVSRFDQERYMDALIADADRECETDVQYPPTESPLRESSRCRG